LNVQALANEKLNTGFFVFVCVQTSSKLIRDKVGGVCKEYQVARAKGVFYAEVGMNSLDNVKLIMRAMGYQLRPQRLENGVA
jgi:hypothetical protein